MTFSHELAPPWVSQLEGFSLDLTVSREQIREASAQLRYDVNRFPPRAGAELKPPFVPRELLRTFIIDWQLSVPAASEDEAIKAVEAYLDWIELQLKRGSAKATEKDAGRWLVRFVTVMATPSQRVADATLEMLRSLPHPYGSPRIGPVVFRPDGSFACMGQIDPLVDKQEDQVPGEELGEEGDDGEDRNGAVVISDEPDFGQIRGWFKLTNYDARDEFSRFLRLIRRGTG